jgi:hypothetical protein
MNIKNYTSSVDASKSLQRIEDFLVEIGATNINKNYDNKVCKGITFLLLDPTTKTTMAFKLKAQVDECFTVLFKDVKRPRADTKNTVMQQASRTAWKILSDWVEIQCTMIILGQAKPLQMFLPYIYDLEKEQTLFDKIEKNPSFASKMIGYDGNK